MSRFFQNRVAGGFRLDSPVKVPVASEMARCAPPSTDPAREEPCQGGGHTLSARSGRSRAPGHAAVRPVEPKIHCRSEEKRRQRGSM